jgi:hypothetical protein
MWSDNVMSGSDNVNKPRSTLIKMAEIKDFACLLHATMQENETIDMFRNIFKILMTEQNEEIHSKIKVLEATMEKHQQQIGALQQCVYDLEQEKLSNNITIYGLGINKRAGESHASLAKTRLKTMSLLNL